MKLIILSFVLMLPNMVLAQINWTEHNITDDFYAAIEAYTIDLDSDNDVDVLGAAYSSNTIAWWENDGDGNFVEHLIDESFYGAYSVYAIDLDSDSDVDVLGAAMSADEIAWWENDGSETFTKHTIDDNFYWAASVFAIDLDGDNDTDVLGAANEDDDITWWENDGEENFTKHTIDGDFDGAIEVFVIDLDGDNDLDVLGVAMDGNVIAWFENDGSQNFSEHVIVENFDGARSVYATDINGDSIIDVLGAACFGNDIRWWENDGSQTFTEHVIHGNFVGAYSVFATDLDEDTDMDILCAGYGSTIAWFENDGNENFSQHTITYNFSSARYVCANDFDNDDDLDVLGVAWNANAIHWWESDLFSAIHDVSTISIDIDTLLVEYTVFSPQATVKNIGTDIETFDVTCEINQLGAAVPGYISTVTVIDLAPDDSIQVTFSPDFVFETDTYSVVVFTQLINDENPENDTLEKLIMTYPEGIADGLTTPISFSFGLKSNPTNKAVFNLILPKDGQVTIKIYDINGRLVDNLSGYRPARYHQINWETKVNGVYFYTFESSSYRKSGKLVVVK
jgi:hypothetical protein